VWVPVLFIGIEHLGSTLKEKWNERKWKEKYMYKREKRPSIIIEMIRATYYKYCPKIDWN
jgi:hypothetical protein